MKTNKVAALVVGAISVVFALSLLLRFVLLSQAGVPAGWMFYLGMPIGGIGALTLLLLRLGLLNLGERSDATIRHWQYNSGVHTPPLASPPPAASDRDLEV